MVILDRLKTFCSGTEDPEVSAALTSNIKTFTKQTFEELANASSALTRDQILSVSSSVLVSSLSTLGSVKNWGQDQTTTIIQSITSSGFQINSAASLESLGTLVVGLRSETIQMISSSEVLSASRNPNLVSNMLEAPKVVQQTFVTKIISVDTNPAKVVQNVPDVLASEIPPSLLVFSERTANINVINRKTWTPDQSAMFIGTLAEINVDIEQFSPSVLQGFSCSSVQKMSKTTIKQMIRACRQRKGRAKVELKEPQLTCMYNLLRDDLSLNFTDYPSDMLLYLNIQDVQKGNCRSYFSALGAADFTVASGILNKGPKKFSEAKNCLGISGPRLSRDNVEVLGNMACSLERSDIENSDPLILENLKACKDLSDGQVAAVETLLLSGKTKYGAVTTWDLQTLEDLKILPLYFTRNIWDHLTAPIKRKFLRGFLPNLRKQKPEKNKLKNLFKKISPTLLKQGEGCTEGNITHTTISDPSFPFGFDVTQFDLCLDVSVLKDNLNALCQKVDDDDFQKIILKKLNQAFPTGVPDQEVQMLASVSRAATLDDISRWSITSLDTLAALMDPENGPWEKPKSKEIITKYLNTSGNSLGSRELNFIDSNLCSLDTSMLQNITSDSIGNAKLLNVASCSAEQKRVLYEISNSSFSIHRDNPVIFYNLVKGYLGGAPRADIVTLSTQNISMDVETFTNLDINVITVSMNGDR
ncbi:mesothelin-like protein [Fundulus heteroclitus]|uniref:mesothelin-like protein n=1 Tax=Fundulus heteroclitus TaxID=8078 RepID=UPI00165BE0F9|nr:mesothelin-like protein [Fundulus heteroclitus]